MIYSEDYLGYDTMTPRQLKFLWSGFKATGFKATVQIYKGLLHYNLYNRN